MNSKITEVTQRIIERSKESRKAYLDQMQKAQESQVTRGSLACGNLAHAFAACADDEKLDLSGEVKSNLAIITAYNDMLSAHKTYEDYPEKLRSAAKKYGGVAQVASGVPAMCDGVTQGQLGMELSLLSRDVIALSTAIGLSHQMFDGGLCLGICDKIVPGMLIGALRFGHLPFIFVPGGPMETGISNEEKAEFRRQYAAGEIDRSELLKAESASYHSAGTCTFYGTANSNQMLMEIMGIHLPGSSFVTPGTPLREALNDFAVKRLLEISAQSEQYMPLFEVISEKSIVNALVGLVATGGSTNHTIHLNAIARAAGIQINWNDFNDISDCTPLLTNVYPNGKADINHFQACGGMGFLIKTLLDGGYLHPDAKSIYGSTMASYDAEPFLDQGELKFRPAPNHSLDLQVLRPHDEPFSSTGGLKLLEGNLGRSVIKVSAVKPEHRYVKASIRVFEQQEEVIEAFKRRELHKDVIVVVRNQGSHSMGMPELHQLTPTLSLIQREGHQVALVTDGRMSGASGKVPAAIHMSPEAAMGGMIARLQDGDVLELDAVQGTLNCLNIEEVQTRKEPAAQATDSYGVGRELFNRIRPLITTSEEGASFII